MSSDESEILRQILFALPHKSELVFDMKNFPIDPEKNERVVDGHGTIKIKDSKKPSRSGGTCVVKLTKNGETLVEALINPSKRELVVKQVKLLWLLSRISLIRALLRFRIMTKRKESRAYKISIDRSIFGQMFSSRVSNKNDQQQE